MTLYTPETVVYIHMHVCCTCMHAFIHTVTVYVYTPVSACTCMYMHAHAALITTMSEIARINAIVCIEYMRSRTNQIELLRTYIFHLAGPSNFIFESGDLRTVSYSALLCTAWEKLSFPWGIVVQSPVLYMRTGYVWSRSRRWVYFLGFFASLGYWNLSGRGRECMTWQLMSLDEESSGRHRHWNIQ